MNMNALPLTTINMPIEEMDKWTAQGFIETTMRGLRAKDIEIFATGMIKSGVVYEITGVPRLIYPVAEPLRNAVANGYSHYLITGTYVLHQLDPYEQVTRADFIMELLDMWERWLAVLPPARQKTFGADIQAAISVLKKTYKPEELIDFECFKEDECQSTSTNVQTDILQNKLFLP